MNDSTRIFTGGCLCGAVTYEIDGPLRDVVACHCGQCRKTSGHHVAATQGKSAGLRITGDERITWFRSSDTAQRGFCAVCGSQLFWQRFDDDNVSIFAGSLNQPTGLRTVSHIHADSAGDYYTIDDGLPQMSQAALRPVVWA